MAQEDVSEVCETKTNSLKHEGREEVAKEIHTFLQSSREREQSFEAESRAREDRFRSESAERQERFQRESRNLEIEFLTRLENLVAGSSTTATLVNTAEHEPDNISNTDSGLLSKDGIVDWSTEETTSIEHGYLCAKVTMHSRHKEFFHVHNKLVNDVKKELDQGVAAFSDPDVSETIKAIMTQLGYAYINSFMAGHDLTTICNALHRQGTHSSDESCMPEEDQHAKESGKLNSGSENDAVKTHVAHDYHNVASLEQEEIDVPLHEIQTQWKQAQDQYQRKLEAVKKAESDLKFAWWGDEEENLRESRKELSVQEEAMIPLCNHVTQGNTKLLRDSMLQLANFNHGDRSSSIASASAWKLARTLSDDESKFHFSNSDDEENLRNESSSVTNTSEGSEGLDYSSINVHDFL